MASDVIGLSSAPTVLGKDITITIKDGNVFLNDTVQVIITDIEASNGVIHVIDAVLLPPSVTLVPTEWDLEKRKDGLEPVLSSSIALPAGCG